MKNLPILTFLARHWLLLVLLAVTVYACLDEQLFQKIGALLYVPAQSAVAIVVSLLIVHLLFRGTVDRDIHDDTFLANWRLLDQRTRTILTVAILVAVFHSVALIAAK
jgi:hypothetical protein